MKSSKRIIGKVKWFNPIKGFGFIESPEFEDDIFLHINELHSSGYTSVISDEPIEIEVSNERKGYTAHNPKRLILEDNEINKLIDILNKNKNEAFRLLLLGRTGVGKSSTVNTLLGTKIAVEGAHEATTMEVKDYSCKINGVPCVVYDTPGLCDGRIEEGNDDKYVSLIKKNVKDFDCLLYFTPLLENRIRIDELRAFDIITKAFGVQAWQRSVLILTMVDRANSSKEYREFLHKRSELLRIELSKLTTDNIGTHIPVVAATNISSTTPDGETWLDDLYASVLAQLKKNALLPFFLATAKRISLKGEKIKNSHNKNNYKKQTNVIILKEDNSHIVERELRTVIGAGGVTALATLGAQIGGSALSIGGPIGAIIGGVAGAAIGAAVGLIAKLFNRKK